MKTKEPKKERKYHIPVHRECVHEYEVTAKNLEQAREKALEQAYNDDWATRQPEEYYITGDKAPECLNKIDFTTLRSQKRTLLELLDKLQDGGEKDDLTGILHLIDAIQDYAVDEMGVPEMHVYDFELEENREKESVKRVSRFDRLENETDEEYFARINADTIFSMHIEGTFLYENEEMSKEFIEKIVDDKEHAEKIKDIIRRDILNDVTKNPDNFDRDENGDFTYDYTMYDYGFAIEDYCLEEFYKNEKKSLWLCPNCGSDNVELKVWRHANYFEGEKNDRDDSTEDEECYCRDCQKTGEVILEEIPYLKKVVGYQVVDDNAGDIHPDMEGSFCIYSLSQARKMLEKDAPGEWKLLCIWSGDIEEPTFMFEGDPRD